MTKSTTLSDVRPSATPTEAEIEAWRELPRDEQLARLRAELEQPECGRLTDLTMTEICAEGLAHAVTKRRG
jgi:hypothetical protein